MEDHIATNTHKNTMFSMYYIVDLPEDILSENPHSAQHCICFLI